MNTPDTEWEKIVGKFWESEVPVEDEYGGDKAGWLKNSPIAKFMLKTLSSRDTYWKERVREEVEGIRKDFVPADLIWEGDEEQEVGEWKFVPKEDGMYCLNCKRFVPEEGCICGLISFEALDTLLDNLK